MCTRIHVHTFSKHSSKQGYVPKHPVCPFAAHHSSIQIEYRCLNSLKFGSFNINHLVCVHVHLLGT